MSTHERDIARFLAELHERLDRAVAGRSRISGDQTAKRWRHANSRWRKSGSSARSAKLKEMDQRLQSAIAQFEAEGRGDHREDSVKLRAAQGRRTSRAPGGENQAGVRGASAGHRVRRDAGGSLSSQSKKASRVRLKGVREPARVRRKLSGGLLEVEAGLMKMQVSTDDVEEVLPVDARSRTASQECFVRARAALGRFLSRDQRHRAARRGSPRSGG